MKLSSPATSTLLVLAVFAASFLASVHGACHVYVRLGEDDWNGFHAYTYNKADAICTSEYNKASMKPGNWYDLKCLGGAGTSFCKLKVEHNIAPTRFANRCDGIERPSNCKGSSVITGTVKAKCGQRFVYYPSTGNLCKSSGSEDTTGTCSC